MDGMNAARVLIGFRDALIADAFGLLLGEAGFFVSICSSEPEELIDRARQSEPDVVVVGSEVLAADGSALALEGLRAAVPGARVVVLFREADLPAAGPLLQHGVSGVITTCADTADAIDILRHVLDGNLVYPEAMLDRLTGPTELLSRRQREVLEQVALGRSNDEIARCLFISRNTVKFHVREIYSRLGVHNRVEAAHAAQRTLADAPGRVAGP